MAGPKRTWWKLIVAVSMLSALFVVAGLIGLPSKASAQGTYNWVNPTTIHVTGFNPAQNTAKKADFDFTCAAPASNSISCTAQGVGACPPTLTIAADHTAEATMYHKRSDVRLGCQADGNNIEVIGAVDKGPGGAAAGGGNNNGNGSNPELEFECGKWNPLNWIVCTMYLAINGIVGQIDNFINTLLYVEQDKIFNPTTPSGAGYYGAWQILRTFSLALLVIGGLVMVIAQALGLEILDTYTIKKVLPRLLLAVIGISLSWQLMQFFVVLTNSLGLGIREIIYFPFQNMPGSLSLGGGSQVVGLLLSSGALLALGAAGLLSFAATALLAGFVAFIVLMIRQLVIVVLIVMAPVAIACSILPNTQGMYKLWYESFTKAMLMFPLIVAFIAVGRVFAVVAIQGGVVNGQLVAATAANQLIGFAAYFLPYFLIPMTFSMAGGAMRFVGGKVNDTGRGGFDRLKKFRGNTMARRGHEWKQGSLYQDRGLGKVINNTGRRANVGTRGRFGFGRTGRAAVATAGLANAQDALKGNASLNELRNYDEANAVLALSGGSRTGAREAVSDLKSQWMQPANNKFLAAQSAFTAGTMTQPEFAAAQEEYLKTQASVDSRAESAYAAANGVGFSRQNSTAAMQTMAQNKSRAIDAGRFDIVQKGMNRLAGGNTAEVAGLQGGYQYFSREAGRADLGGSWASGDIQQKATDFAARAGISQQEAMADMVALDGMERTDVSALLRGHTGQTKQNTTTLKRMMIHGDNQQRELAATRLLELQKNISYAPGANQKIINETLNSAEIGVDYNDTSKPIELQLTERVNYLNARSAAPGATVARVDPTALSRGARTYDREAYEGQQRMGGSPKDEH